MTTPSQERVITIRRGPVYYEWKHYEQDPGHYKTTKVPRGLHPKDAGELICAAYCHWTGASMVTLAWELCEEDLKEGRPIYTEADLNTILKLKELKEKALN